MLERSRLRTRTAWTALLLALFLLPGLASAQLNKDEQKCVNTTNKNAQKIGDAQGKDISACIKDRAKAKNSDADACAVSDPKGKVAKAKSGYDSKTAKDCALGSGFMSLADAEAAKDAAMNKELDILHMIYGSDVVDGFVILEEDEKTDSKCQQALIKAVYKCQATKWKEFNSCKKNKIKGKDTSQATTSVELQEECLGENGTTDGVPDPKGKIAKKCDFSGTISKKCPNTGIFPGCPGGSLNACLDAIVECKFCLTIDGIDGLGRNCDEFDDGVVNLSCPPSGTVLGTHLSTQDDFAVCEGGDNAGAECKSALPLNPDPNGLNVCTGDGGTCVPKASHLITSNQDNVIEIPSLTDSMTEITCGEVQPDGTAVCTSESLDIAGQNIFPIGYLCFRPRPDLNCPAGLIDCDGGTPMDQDAIMIHDAAVFANNADPGSFPFVDCRVNPADVGDVSCFGAGGPSCTANQTCSDMCDLYCASLGPAYEQETSGCEGICQGQDPNSTKFGAVCVAHGDCAEALELTIDDVSCAGGSLNSPHAGQCQCECQAHGIGAPGRPGSLMVNTGLQSWIESGAPCDQTDVTIVLEPDCVEFTTELSTATVLDDGAELGVNWTDVPLMGDPGGGCSPLSTSVTSGASLVSHSGNFDSGIGDVVSRSTTVTK